MKPFYDFYKVEKFDPLFTALENCRGIEQGEKYHPEKDVFEHSLQVLSLAFRESSDIDLIVAAMLHDVGKQVAILDHDIAGVKLLENHISEKTSWLIKNHLRVWYYLLGDMKRYQKVKDISEHKWFLDLIKLARWDKAGRNPKLNFAKTYNRNYILETFRRLNIDK